MTVTHRPRHRAWCPARTSPQFGCYCRNGRLELSDPRPEVVEAGRRQDGYERVLEAAMRVREERERNGLVDWDDVA